MKISELTDTQKSHLAWRLDHKTYVGMGTAAHIARGGKGDLDLVEVFKWAGCSDHSAKSHARKVINFNSGCACCGAKQTNDQMTVITEGEHKEHCCSVCTERIPCDQCGAVHMRGNMRDIKGRILCKTCQPPRKITMGLTSDQTQLLEKLKVLIGLGTN